MIRSVVAIVLTMPTLGNAATTVPPFRSKSSNVRISTSDVARPRRSACVRRLSTFWPFEQYLTKMRIWLANPAGLALIFLGYLFELSGSQDSNVLGFARFLVIVGGIGAATLSLGGALGGKRTTDMQNLGLLVWAGLLLWFTTKVLASVR